MLLTNKNTGKSFYLNTKEAADFFHAKNAKGLYINSSDDYIVRSTTKEISTLKFMLGCVAVLSVMLSCIYLFFTLNF